jgi:hypothetical protein
MRFQNKLSTPISGIYYHSIHWYLRFYYHTTKAYLNGKSTPLGRDSGQQQIQLKVRPTSDRFVTHCYETQRQCYLHILLSANSTPRTEVYPLSRSLNWYFRPTQTCLLQSNLKETLFIGPNFHLMPTEVRTCLTNLYFSLPT